MLVAIVARALYMLWVERNNFAGPRDWHNSYDRARFEAMRGMKAGSIHCTPCEGGINPLTAAEARRRLQQIPAWQISGRKLHRRFVLENFVAAMALVNRVAKAAEAEGHHPDFTVHYNEVHFVLWTHAVGGLSERDFVLAARIDTLAKTA